MGALSDAAAKRFRSIRRRPELPLWWPLLQGVCAVALVLFLGWSAIRQVDEQSRTEPAATLPGSGPVPVGPAETTTSDVSSSTLPPGTDVPSTSPGTTTEIGTLPAGSTTVPDLGGRVTLPGPNSTQVSVPVAALDRARAALRGAFGDGAALTNELVAFASAENYVISADVDADGTGPLEPVTQTVAVRFEGGFWLAQL